MTTIILGALVLALLQYWLIPSSTKLAHAKYLIGTRDEPLELTVMQMRMERAANNLKESMVPFLALAFLAMINEVEAATDVAMYWLGFRVLFVPCYLFGLNPFRTIVWLGSLFCLLYMGYLVA